MTKSGEVKEREEERPWGDGEAYNRYIVDELASFRKAAWKKQITAHFGQKDHLRILDVGTGPGFFSCILAEEGHDVTGIDYSENMLKCARENAARLGVHGKFCLMDINELVFEDSSFDVIISRNVTWTLPKPENTYRDFYRILKKGGIMLIYDANWHLHFFDVEKMKKVRENEERYFQKYGRRELVAIEKPDFFKNAPLTSIVRPAWDKKTLEGIGMQVKICEDVGKNVYEEWEKELYAESPLFEICAIK